jgi:thioester reductase-like protein
MGLTDKSWILITGATGYLGKFLVGELSSYGYNLILLVRSKEKGKQLASTLLVPSEKVWILAGDISLPRLGLASEAYHLLGYRIEAIIHCAALTKFNPSPIQAFRYNIIGTKNLLTLAQKTGRLSSFHYVSTAYVAGRRQGIVREDELDGRYGFHNLYEQSKFLAECLLQQYQSQYLTPITVYRPGIIIGDLKTGSYWNIFGVYHFLVLLNRLANNLPIRLLGNPRATKNLVPIDYVVETMTYILQNKHHWGKTYHLSLPHPPTLELLEEAFNRTLGRKVVELVNEKAFQEKPRNRREAFIARQTQVYQPYLLEEPIFDTSNTQKALKGSGIVCPTLDLETLIFLLSNAQGGLINHVPVGVA